MSRPEQIALLMIVIVCAAIVAYLFAFRNQVLVHAPVADDAPVEQPDGQSNPRDSDPLGTINGVQE